MHDPWLIIICRLFDSSHSARPRALRLLVMVSGFFFITGYQNYGFFIQPNPSVTFCMFLFRFFFISSLSPSTTYHYLTIPLHPLLPSFFSFLFHFILSPTLYSTPTLHYSLHFTTFTTFRMTFFYFSNTHLNFYFFFLLLHHCRSLLSPSKYILSIHN